MADGWMDGWTDSNKRASSFVINRLARNDVITLFFLFFFFVIIRSLIQFLFIFFLSSRGRSENLFIYLFIIFHASMIDRIVTTIYNTKTYLYCFANCISKKKKKKKVSFYIFHISDTTYCM